MDTRYGRVEWGPGKDRRLTQNWSGPAKWNREATKRDVRKKVFTLSLGDFFDNSVPAEWRARAWQVIRSTPMLDWLIVTKRPGNIHKMLPSDWDNGWDNVWLGTTVENQEEAKRRVPVLLEVPAALVFLSVEPMLEPIEFGSMLDMVNWVIVGGETGHGYRVMEADWARSVLAQCRRYDTAFFMKQMSGKKEIPSDLLIREFPA